MNTVPLQPEEIKARNARAAKIVANANAAAKQKLAAKRTLTK